MNPFARIGIIGEGRMGTSIFHLLLEKGCTISWICSSQADRGKLEHSFRKRMGRLKDNGIITLASHENILLNTCITADLSEAGRCDLILETITEDTGLKKELFRSLDQIARPDAIMASNSSSILPAKMVPSERRAPLFLGLHFFYPVAMKNITEVIVNDRVSKDSVLKTTAFLGSVGRKYILLDEQSAFILNRIFLDFQNEAFLLVNAGKMSCSQLDAIIREYFFPVGVFEFFDSVGTDLMLTSIKNYTEDYPHRDHFAELIRHLEEMVGKGHLGKKSNQGFYNYSEGKTILQETLQPTPDVDRDEKIEFLRFQYQNAVRRHTVRSGLSLTEMNDALKEYFSIDKGPFEI